MTELRYLGFDVGGSTTVCVAGDASASLGRGVAGPGNPTLVGIEGFRSAILEAAEAAQEGLSAAPISAAWLGVAGSERPGCRAELLAVARTALRAERVEISHDARLLLAAADVDHGIGLVSGTGSSAYGRSADGAEVSAGGWGHLLGDEGSGYDIAVRALRAVTSAIDGRGPDTVLVRLLTERLGASEPAQLRERSYPPASVTAIAALATTVLAAADEDAVAGSILDSAADDLVALVDGCASRLAAGPGARVVPVVLAGGLLGPGSALYRRVVARLAARSGAYDVVHPRQELAAAGLALARAGPTGRSPAPTRVRDSGPPAIEERNS
jgi:N-acetylglucosamine kinase-like BadF-type ATPase